MHKQGSVITGTILILVGLFFLSAQFFPAIGRSINFAFLWPLIVLAVGLFFLVGGIINTPSLFVPGSIISGVGLILFYQNSTGNWHHWQLWMLVNCFIGLGILLDSWRSGRGISKAMSSGGFLIGLGLILFFVFSFADLWPVALIVVGLGLLGRNMLRRRNA